MINNLGDVAHTASGPGLPDDRLERFGSPFQSVQVDLSVEQAASKGDGVATGSESHLEHPPHGLVVARYNSCKS